MIPNFIAWLKNRAQENAVNYLKHQANANLNNKDWSQAEKTLLKILELDPDQEETLISLSSLLRKENRLEEGVTLLRKAIEINPSHLEKILKFVEAYQLKKDYDSMKNLLFSMLQQFPEAVPLRLYLAQRLFENSHIHESQNELYEVLKYDPANLEADIGLAYCFIAHGKKDKALAQVEKIKKLSEPKANEVLSAIYQNVQNF
ncbi:MAG: tetratricopeptide repeat protein [SAR324 cluster bacterium]|nr:tetratricopeptide repeat protein [SAR324 cluster bacterium]